MATFTTPGVFIEEISTIPAAVAGVATGVPIFVGYTEKAGTANELVLVPTKVRSLLEFEQLFGGPDPEDVFTVTITDDMGGGTTVVNRTISAVLTTPSIFKLYYSMRFYFDNGGGPCYIVSVKANGYSAGVVLADLKDDGLAAVEKADEPTIIAFPDAVSLPSLTDYGTLAQASLQLCNKMKDRFTVLDTKFFATGEDVTDYRNALGMNNLKYGAAYFPFLKTVLNFEFNDATTGVVDHIRVNPSGTGPYDGNSLNQVKAAQPDLYSQIYVELNNLHPILPPSGAMCGIYAAVDRDRGVWKAPANVSVNSVVGPAVNLTAEEQGEYNVDPSTGKSINVIRAFTGKGTLVWGARTLAGNDNEWRYVPVRRLFIYVEESLQKASEFVVFEPNDKNTWTRVKTSFSNFLTGLWRDGALTGATPEQAFFINVGLGETMTQDDILNGIMRIRVGLAAVRPAEFIVLEFVHKLQEA